jgi:hypothetical protein
MDSWNIRDEIKNLTNQWYVVFLVILLGGLVGFCLSYLVPAPYRATADLYVGIDVTRVNEMEYLIPLAKEEPLNLDDYKNWQLKQVSSVILSELVLENTLAELAEEDAFWKEMTTSDFRKNLDIYWFDTGVWQLEVLNSDKSQAELAVQIWLDEGYKKLGELLEVSKTNAILDAQLFALADDIGLLKGRISRLETFLSSAEEWLDIFENAPPDDPLPEDLRDELDAWILVYRKNQQYWQVPVGNLPGKNGPVSQYISWLTSAKLIAQKDIEESRPQLALLVDDREAVLPEYHQGLEDSLGLSANIVLEPNISQPTVDKVRSSGTMTLGGGILGIMVWLIYTLIMIEHNRKRNA